MMHQPVNGVVNVVYVDQDTETATNAARSLEDAGERLAVEPVAGPATVLEYLDDDGRDVDCIVSAYALSEQTGLELLDAVREVSPVPFILHPEDGTERLASEAITAGVTEYVSATEPATNGAADEYGRLADRIEITVRQSTRGEPHGLTTNRQASMLREFPESVTVLDTDGVITYGNRQFQQRVGVGPVELAGTTIFEYIHPADHDTVRATIDDVLTEGHQSTIEHRLRTTADEWTWVESTLTKRHQPTTEPAVLVNSRARSEPTRTDEHPGWYETLLETLPVGVLVLDENATIEWVNEPFWSAIDKTESEVVGRRFLELIEEGLVEEELAMKYWELIQDLRSPEVEDEQGTIEFTVDPPHEEGYREYVGYISLKPSEDGEFNGTVNAFRDVTERRERERELEQYKAAMETVPDGVFLLDGTGTIIRVNEAWASIVGYDPEELNGEPFTKLVEDGVVDRTVVEQYRELIQRLLASDGEDGDDQVEFRTRVTPPDDDREHVYEIHAGLLPYEETFEGTAAVVRDVTDQVDRQHRLERENERLEKFASVVSHDLRNPLNVVSGSLELAERSGDSEHFDRARGAVDRMNRLIDDLLTLAQQGDQIEETERIELAEIATTCWDTVETNGATIEVATTETVQADPSRLKQLLENLFRNAIEHGGSDVTVTVGPLTDRSGFYIADDGVGIPEDERDRVFESGYSTAAETTGFGLSIVAEVVDAHDWSIEVTEAAAGGARFEIITDTE